MNKIITWTSDQIWDDKNSKVDFKIMKNIAKCILKNVALLCSLSVTILCAQDIVASQDPEEVQNDARASYASDNCTTRHYYVHQNQLRQQLLQITGPTYNAASMNLGQLYQLTAFNGNLTLGSLVNSSTIGNVTLGSVVNSSTMGNITLAAMISNMQNYALLTATTYNNFTITTQNPSGLISTDGTIITFNVAGTYMITGSFMGSTTTINQVVSFSDGFSGGATTYSFSLIAVTAPRSAPVTIPYRAIYPVTAGATLQFSSSNMLLAPNIKLNIVRIR